MVGSSKNRIAHSALADLGVSSINKLTVITSTWFVIVIEVNNIRASNRASNIKITITKILIGYYTLSIVNGYFKIGLGVAPNLYCTAFKNNTGKNTEPILISIIALNYCLHHRIIALQSMRVVLQECEQRYLSQRLFSAYFKKEFLKGGSHLVGQAQIH